MEADQCAVADATNTWTCTEAGDSEELSAEDELAALYALPFGGPFGQLARLSPTIATPCESAADCADTAALAGEYGGDFGPWTCAELSDPDTEEVTGNFCAPLIACEDTRLTDSSGFPDIVISKVSC